MNESIKTDSTFKQLGLLTTYFENVGLQNETSTHEITSIWLFYLCFIAFSISFQLNLIDFKI